MATRCQIVGGLRPDIVSSVNQLLHNDNHYVQLFKVAKELFDQQDIYKQKIDSFGLLPLPYHG